MKAFLALLSALPEIIKLLQVLQKRIDEAELDRKISVDIKTIHEAFDAKDPDKLNALFNSM